MKKIFGLVVLLLAAALLWLALFLFRPFLTLPAPASLQCIDPADGQSVPLTEPGRVFGLGLSYAGHISESPGLYDPASGPPVFRKHSRTINRSDRIPYPSREDLLEAAARLNADHSVRLAESVSELPPLLDYEVEIGLTILQDFPVSALARPDFAPPIGYFVANDITARILLAMAPSIDRTVSYLAEGKGLTGFLPVGDRVFIPERPRPNSWVCVELLTEVNGEVRQRASSADIVFSARQILQQVARNQRLQDFLAGDWIITGTPAGVALQTPGWLQRSLILLDPSAKTKISSLAGSAAADSNFLHPGDEVRVSAGFLGSKTSRVIR